MMTHRFLCVRLRVCLLSCLLFPLFSNAYSIPNYGIRGPIKWECLSPSVQDDYTMKSTIPVLHMYIDESSDSLGHRVWNDVLLRTGIEAATQRRVAGIPRSYGDESVLDLYDALADYPVRGLDALVLGSQNPWIEVILVGLGARSVTTVDFNPIQSGLPDIIKTHTITSFENQNHTLYDAIFSYSSIEHDGLGRYGDPLNPNGDIERMQVIRRHHLKKNGLLYFGVPAGKDCLVWNAHRIYGVVRWPRLIDGYETVKIFERKTGAKVFSDFSQQPLGAFQIQPWVVLRKAY